MMTLSIEDKYKWLCSKLTVTDVSWWEADAVICINDESSFYFQFPLVLDEKDFTDKYIKDVLDVDKAIERCMGEHNEIS